MGLDELYLSRTRLDLLREAGMRTIRDVELRTNEELLDIPGVGPATVELIRRRIGELV